MANAIQTDIKTSPSLGAHGLQSNTPMPTPLTPQMTARSVHALSHNYATKSPLVTMECPTFNPKTASSPFNDLQSHLIHHSLNLSHSPPQTASRSNQPFFHNSSTEQTDQLTDWQMGEATRLLQHPLMLYSLYRNVANNTACYNLINHRMGKF